MRFREWFKSAITGLFVSKRAAQASPAMTIAQHVAMPTEECDRPLAAEACTEVAPKRSASQRAKRKPRK